MIRTDFIGDFPRGWRSSNEKDPKILETALGANYVLSLASYGSREKEMVRDLGTFFILLSRSLSWGKTKCLLTDLHSAKKEECQETTPAEAKHITLSDETHYYTATVISSY